MFGLYVVRLGVGIGNKTDMGAGGRRCTYRLLNLEEILEKKLVRPECGESPVAPPVPEYSSAVLFRGLVCPAMAEHRNRISAIPS